MPSTPQGVLLVIGAIFIAIGILGGGFEVSAIRIPPIGSYPRIFAFIVGIAFTGIAVWLLLQQNQYPENIAANTPTPRNEPAGNTSPSPRSVSQAGTPQVTVVPTPHVFDFPGNNTSWSVSDFQQGKVGGYGPPLWVFQNSSVHGETLWSGDWHKNDVGKDTIHVKLSNGDEFDVVFVSSRWFVAVKDQELYRLGKLQSGTPVVDIDLLGNKTSWSVSDFQQGKVGGYGPPLWVFQNSSVHGETLWSGDWHKNDVGKDTIHVKLSNGDEFDVVFVSSRWFVAVKDQELYRLGKQSQ